MMKFAKFFGGGYPTAATVGREIRAAPVFASRRGSTVASLLNLAGASPNWRSGRFVERIKAI